MRKLNPNDYIDKVYGNLKIKSYVGYEKNNHFFYAECSCGSGIKKYRLSDLKSECGTKTCGECRGKHRQSHTRLYKTWKNMKNRCNNIKNKEYYCYGARGITVCEEWNDNFQSFYNWSIENGYSDDLTIDRIDNNKGYMPSNCQFLARSENIRKANFEREYKCKHTIKGINTNGEQFIFSNTIKFSKENNLCPSSILKVCNGKYKQHKGWSFSYID